MSVGDQSLSVVSRTAAQYQRDHWRTAYLRHFESCWRDGQLRMQQHPQWQHAHDLEVRMRRYSRRLRTCSSPAQHRRHACRWRRAWRRYVTLRRTIVAWAAYLHGAEHRAGAARSGRT